ncbi:MAG: ECF transporter S component [Clostridia bacterium]|nr:ECF transporter S component [Clostridia bacterium]
MRNTRVKRLVLASMLLALGMVLPLLTGQIKEIGDSLLPMHLAVMLCGLICGAGYGGAVGLMLPFLRSLIFGMPPLYPNAVWMALELATYGIVIGWLYSKAIKTHIGYVYVCLASSMVAGRVVWGITKSALLGIAGKTVTIGALVVDGFIDAIPGIILQLVLIPLIMHLISKRMVRNEKN